MLRTYSKGVLPGFEPDDRRLTLNWFWRRHSLPAGQPPPSSSCELCNIRHKLGRRGCRQAGRTGLPPAKPVVQRRMRSGMGVNIRPESTDGDPVTGVPGRAVGAGAAVVILTAVPILISRSEPEARGFAEGSLCR